MWFAGPARRVGGGVVHGALDMGLHLEPGMRVGLFGGSFNPAHEGHAHVAATALKRLGLDRVVWLVSPQNPLKPRHETGLLSRRVWGAARWAQGPSMIVSAAETRIGSFYTIDTVRALKARYPKVKFVWIMGADSLLCFHRWRGWTELFGEIPMGIVARPGSTIRSRFAPAARRFAHSRVPASRARLLPDLDPPAWTFLEAPWHDVSSTAIRSQLKAGGD